MESWQLILAAVALSLIAFLSWHYLTYGFTPQKGGLPIYPFLGILPCLAGHKDDLWQFLSGVLENTPNMSFFGAAPGVSWFFTANPLHIQHILKDNFSNYPKGDDLRDASGDLLGHGIFTSDGEQWKQQRKMASYEFSTNSLRRLMQVSVREEIDQRLIPLLEWAVANAKVIDMHDVFLRFTFDNICRMGFGVDTAALSTDFHPVPFATSMDRATILNSMRVSVPRFMWKVLRYFQLGSELEFTKEMMVVDQFLREVIAKRRKDLAGKLQHGSDSSTEKSALESHSFEKTNAEAFSLERSDLLSRMMALGERDHGQVFDDNFLRDACLNFMIAGRDTTAVTLSWLFYELTRHPEVEEKIVEELDSILEQRASDKAADFSFEELKLMPYTHAAINETLRLHATVPIDQKVAAEDDVLPDGTFIGKNWRISYCIYATGRMTRVWGPDALDFKPERWIAADGQLKVESPFKFVAFNAGPRLCLGRDMAYLQMKLVVSSVLRKFTLNLVPDQQVTYAISLTLLMKNGLRMTVSPRTRDP